MPNTSALPPEAKALFARIKQSSLAAGDDEHAAEMIAWRGLANAGWAQAAGGRWVVSKSHTAPNTLRIYVHKADETAHDRLEALAESEQRDGESLAQSRLRVAEANPELWAAVSSESAPAPTTRRFTFKNPVAKVLPPAGPARDAYEILEQEAAQIRATDPDLQGMDPTRAERLALAKAYVLRPDCYNVAFG